MSDSSSKGWKDLPNNVIEKIGMHLPFRETVTAYRLINKETRNLVTERFGLDKPMSFKIYNVLPWMEKHKDLSKFLRARYYKSRASSLSMLSYIVHQVLYSQIMMSAQNPYQSEVFLEIKLDKDTLLYVSLLTSNGRVCVNFIFAKTTNPTRDITTSLKQGVTHIDVVWHMEKGTVSIQDGMFLPAMLQFDEGKMLQMPKITRDKMAFVFFLLDTVARRMEWPRDKVSYHRMMFLADGDEKSNKSQSSWKYIKHASLSSPHSRRHAPAWYWSVVSSFEGVSKADFDAFNVPLTRQHSPSPVPEEMRRSKEAYYTKVKGDMSFM